MPKILLLSDGESVTFPCGSKENVVTSRDPLPVKVYKFLENEGLTPVLSTKLNIVEISENDWIIFFPESEIEIDEALNFCEKNKCNILILKEDIEIKKSTGFKLIHNSSLYNLPLLSKVLMEEISKN